jgi:tetratricopeptide (TPR) repeat protein
VEKINWIEDYLEEAIRLSRDEGHETALRLLDKLLYEEERLDEAVKVYLKGTKAKQAPKSGLLEGAGKAYELKKKYNKAIEHYKNALSHSAELWECLVIENSITRCKRKQK